MKCWTAARALAQVSTLAVIFNACFTILSSPAPARADSAPVRIVAFGDSLTAGYGLPPGEAFPAQLERALKARGHTVAVINAGVSGDTTAAGLQRFDWTFAEKADAAIVALGANDALRGIDPAQSRQNLNRILTKLNVSGTAVLLAGMKAPRNWGDDYVNRFDAIFPDLAAKHDALLYPFFIESVALRPELNLDDGMHPNSKGVQAMVEAIMPKVEELIARVKSARGPAIAN